MKIIVDAFGGDNAPLEIIKGCREALEVYKSTEILLVGDEKKIRKAAGENGLSLDRMEIHHAPDVITMEDDAGEILKSKKDCSMAEGLRLLAQDDGDAFLSAGNSGALLVGATMFVKRIKGVKRAAFAPLLPKSEGMFLLIDGGANVECRPEMLCQFGIMGSVYMNRVMNIKNPRVGLANIGTEEHKGGELQHEAYKLLKNAPLNFVGNIEARDIPNDGADVIVADGFTGNIIVKMYEGVGLAMFGKIKEIFYKNTKNKMAALMIKKDLGGLKQYMDYNNYGAAPIMGISKPVLKTHGSSSAKTFVSSIGSVIKFTESGAIETIQEHIAIGQSEAE